MYICIFILNTHIHAHTYTLDIYIHIHIHTPAAAANRQAVHLAGAYPLCTALPLMPTNAPV